MSSLFKYIDKYGNSSFLEEPFNEVDNVILSSLSYIDFSQIVSEKRVYKNLNRVAIEIFSKYTQNDIESLFYTIRQSIKLLNKIKDYKRYQNLLLYNYISKKSNSTQFSALCIKISSDLIYVSYEGTDEALSGWKEDFELSYKFPVEAQKDAIKYLNDKIKFRDKKVIIGGHSKGGNLALVASMYCNFWIRRKIIKIYSNDGPGLLEEQLHSKKIENIASRYIHIIPNYSIVGLILAHPDNDRIIKSSKKGMLSHDLLTWEVIDNKFITTELSNSSTRFRAITTKWLKEYTKEEKEQFVLELFRIFESENITNLLELKDNKLQKILHLIKNSKKLDDKTKSMIKDLIIITVQDYSDTTKKVIKNTIKEGKNILKK